jgi:hypothetical protein
MKRPNTRVQRTRSLPSALRSPLTRSPLGAPSIIGVAAELGLAPALGASRAALFASGIRPKEGP